MSDIPSHLGQNTLVIVTIQQTVLLLSLSTSRTGRRRVLVSLEAGLFEDNDQPPRLVLLGVRFGRFGSRRDQGGVEGRGTGSRTFARGFGR